MSRRLRSDDGIVLIVAMIVLTIVIGMGLGVMALADSQNGPARDERARVSSGGLAEAVLTEQVFQLSRLPWPQSSAGAPAGLCTALAATPDSCPDATPTGSLAQTFNAATSPDYNGSCPGPAWSSWVADNGAPVTPPTPPPATRKYYSTSGLSGMPAYDANGDGILWVGASATVRLASGCQTRRVVTQVQASSSSINFPHNVVTANWLQITGKAKAIVDTTGQHAQPKTIRPGKKKAAPQPAPVQVRCTTPLPGGIFDPCLVYGKDQVKPNSGAKVPTLPAAMFTPAQLAGFQQQAAAAGTYYTGCPSSLTGKIVVIEDVSSCGAFNNGGNDKNNPGFLIVKRGRLQLAGKGIFYGLIYHANLGLANTSLVYLSGSAVVQGGVSVDGLGGVNPATKRTAIIYDARPFSLPTVRTNAIAVPGTWRELNPSE
jgi:Tfp pilus assembly protein PilX